MLYSRSGRPVHTSDARIMLADIPFVRLRAGIPSCLQDSQISFHQMVEEVQSNLKFISLSFDSSKTSICCGGKWIKLSPTLFAFYLWLARRRVAGLPDSGLIRWQDANPEDYMKIYSEVAGPMSATVEKAGVSLKDGFERAFFEQKSSKINRILKQELPLEASIYQVATFGEKPYKKYGLRLTQDQIVMR